MNKNLIYWFFAVALISCDEQPEVAQQQNNISRILIAYGGCFGVCPVQTFSIDSGLILNYSGVSWVKDTGSFCGTVEASTWNEINRKLESINYVEMDTMWAPHTVDALSYEIWIYHADGIKKIRSFNYYEFPDSVRAIFDWIETVAVNQPKTPCSNIQFEKTLVVPPPNIDSFQFTEPPLE